MVGIRKEHPGDIPNIWKLNAEAFETEAEANLVDALRKSGVRYISLVYEEKKDLLGHIFFTPVDLVGQGSGMLLMGLAPMAVVPDRQRQGIGTALVKAGIKECVSEDYDAVFVLGHPDYYPRFGFVPSVKYGIRCEFNVPDDVFMVKELKKNILKGKGGTIKYHKAFRGLQ